MLWVHSRQNAQERGNITFVQKHKYIRKFAIFQEGYIQSHA